MHAAFHAIGVGVDDVEKGVSHFLPFVLLPLPFLPQHPVRPSLPRVADPRAEPVHALGLPAVGDEAVEFLGELGADEGEGADGVRAEADAGADLAELGRGLVDRHGDVLLQEADGQREPADAAADDGDVEWLGGGRRHDGGAGWLLTSGDDGIFK